MILGAVDMPPAVSLTIGILLALLACWYWQRLRRSEFEGSTRAIRRASLFIGLVAVFVLVRAASFIDSEVSPSAYVSAWLLGLALIFIVVLLILCDVLNNFRMHRRFLEQEALQSAARLHSDLQELSEASDAPTGGGE